MKVIKSLKYLLAIAVVLVCEFVFAKHIEFMGTAPMIAFCFSVVLAVFEKNLYTAASVAFALGTLIDMLSGHGFGIYGICFAMAATVTFFCHDSLFFSKMLFLVCDVFVLTVVTLVIYVLFHVRDIGIGGITQVLPTALYNIPVTLIFFLFGKKIMKL